MKMKIKKHKKIIMLGVIMIAVLASVGFGLARNGYFGGGDTIPEDTMTRGLVASWDFDEGQGDVAYDATTNNNHGNFPHTGPGLKFEGDNDYVDCSNHNDLNITAAITIEAWVNINEFNDNKRTMVTKFDVDAGTPYSGYEMLLGGGDANKMGMNLNINGTHYGPQGTTILSLNTWYHWVLVYNGTTSFLYLDGNSETISTGVAGAGSIVSNNLPVFIGARPGSDGAGNYVAGNNNNYFNGSIDEVRIYSRAITAAEVNEHYHGIFSDDTGRVGYWPFDEGEGDVVDNSGTCGAACDGDLDGYTTAEQVAGFGDTNATGWTTLAAPNTNFAPSWTSGKQGGGLAFDGENDYVDCGNDSSLDITDAITIEAWVKHNALDTSHDRVIISKRIGNDALFILRKDTDTNKLAFVYDRRDDGGESAQYTTTDAILQIDVWQHIVFTFTYGTSASAKFYYQGAEKGGSWTVGNGNEIPSTTAKVSIGADKEGTSEFFNGSIDGVKIYNRALNAEEVRYHYNRGGPVAHWKFDEGSGSVAYNHRCPTSVDSNLNGTIYGATGTATGTHSATTLQDTNKSWTADEWIGETATIYFGTCATVSQTITDNDTDTITVHAWGCTPDNTSIYKITSKDEWTTGKHKTGLSFDGVDDYVDIGDTSETSVKTISFWLKADDITSRDIIDLNGVDYIGINADSVITATGFTGVVYIDAVPASTIDTNWHHITVTTDTGQDASNLDIGRRDGGTYFDGVLDDVRIYAYARSAEEIRLDYNAGFAAKFGPSGKSCSEDPASCMDYGLVASYDMDEGSGDTLYDQSDNGNDGTLGSGAGADTSDPKWINRSQTSNSSRSLTSGSSGALSFDGSDDYVNCGNDASLDITDAITIEAWVKWNQILTSGSFNGGILVSKASGLIGWQIGIDANDLVFYTRSAGGISKSYLYSASNLTLNQWYHIVGTRNIGGTFTLYVDGVDVGQTTPTKRDISTSYNVRIGVGYSNDFNGSIDGVKIYNRALSAEEVRYHYNRGGPVAHWKMDEGSGTTLLNSGSGFTSAAGLNRASGSIKSSALDFDGSNDFVDCGSDSSLNITDAITLEAWVKADVLGPRMGIVTKHGIAGDGMNKDFWFNKELDDKIQFLVNNTGGDEQRNAASTITLTTDWTHVVGTYDGTNIGIFINGEDKTGSQAGTGSGVLRHSTQPVTIGWAAWGSYYFNGSIDGVRIYNKALHATTIANHYKGDYGTYEKTSGGSDLTDDDLVLYIPFDDAAGDTATNYGSCGGVAANCNGTLTNYTTAEQVAKYGDSHDTGWVIDTDFVAARQNTGLDFGGVNGFFQSDSYIPAASSTSYSLWFKSSNGTYSANEYLFSQGNDDPSVYIDTSGNIKVMAEDGVLITSATTVLDTK